MNHIYKLSLLFIFFSAPFLSRAGIVTGKVTDTAGNAVPYASVYIKGTSRGTSTNTAGVYTIELQPGSYTLVFQGMGFKSETRTISIASDKKTLNVSLKEEALMMNEVTIKAGEDPAYNMIRHAIKKRKYYRDQVKAYSCDVYIKGLQRLTKHPKKLMGMDVKADEMELIDTVHDIIYLSESVSKFNFRQPDDIKEEMVSSKVSGDNKAFSYNSASDLLFNFYDAVMQAGELSERGFVSPIAPDAMLYYKYKLAGTYQENGLTIDKIEVIPRRKNDPVFRGYIYLEESGWRLYTINLYLTKDAQIDFVDTLLINQTFVPVDSNTWMPFMNKYYFHVSVLGFMVNGVYVGVNSNYNLSPQFPKHYFNGEDMKIDPDANKKDTGYWHDTRPVPLTQEEYDDYHKRDSIMAIRNSKKYLDSVDKKNNRFHLGNIWQGYTYINRYKKYGIGFSSLLSDVKYNTVQGLYAGLQPFFYKNLDRNRYYRLQTEIGYGFGDKMLNASASWNYLFRAEKFSSINLSAGRRAEQFNGHIPISPLINELYTLIDKQNLMKLYQQNFAKARYSTELINGVQLTTSLSYEKRSPLVNTTYFTFSKADKAFTTNDPQQNLPEGQPSFAANNALLFDAGLAISFKQRYYTRPFEKIIQESKYPKLNLYYKKGISGLGSTVNYDYVQASLSGKFNLKMAGNSEWSITAGKYLNNKAMYFMDYYHFPGNQTIFANDNGFQLLPYYQYSTNEQFAWGHFEHHFGGLILNKIPLLRKLKLSEIGGVNYITSNTLHQYAELYAGVEKLRTFSLIFAAGFNEGQKTYATFRIGFSAKGLLRFD